MKLLSWNVNGVRSASSKGFLDWFESERADVVCLQETKASQDQLSEEVLHPLGYSSYWHSAQKAGYSGVAIYSKKEPLEVRTGLGDPAIDAEGRVLVAEYKDFVLINGYFPNSQREGVRLPFKLHFNQQLHRYTDALRAQGKSVVICGDFNVAHQPIDLKNPKSNEKNAGYLPEERAWMESFLQGGYVDTFRSRHPDQPGHYTWWSYRPGVREKNVGWRIDYFVVNREFEDAVSRAAIQHEVRGSDHCPVELQIRL